MKIGDYLQSDDFQLSSEFPAHCAATHTLTPKTTCPVGSDKYLVFYIPATKNIPLNGANEITIYLSVRTRRAAAARAEPCRTFDNSAIQRSRTQNRPEP